MSTVKPVPTIAPPFVATRIFTILVPLFVVLFAWGHAAAFVQSLRISTLIMLTHAALYLHFYVRKFAAPFISTSAYAWLIALCGTLTSLMFRPSDDASDFWGATMLQVIGGAMQIYLIRLGQSFGPEEARQGIRRHSLYRFVRHPLCLAFMFSQYGYVLNHTTIYNLCILALVTFFQVLRINEEERLLLEDEEFQGYVKQTPWRIVPGVF